MKISKFLVLTSLISGLSANAAGIESVGSVTNTANVKGSVTLQAKANFPTSLEALWSGRSEVVAKKKVVKVEGEYTPGNLLTVEESDLADSVEDNEGAYSFDFSVLSVMNTFAKKARATSKQTSVLAAFANELDTENDEESSNESVESVVSVLNTPINVSETLSVTKLIAIRKGSKGILRGSFVDATKAAKGRFKLNFTF